MKRIPRKAYRPKPTDSGQPISWSEVGPEGFSIARTGVVWSKSPVPRGYWVVPDDGRDPFVEVVIPAEGNPRLCRAISRDELRSGIEVLESSWSTNPIPPAKTGTDNGRK